jgi:heme/copper-type cytochrome/quinol oxidase subunit 3
VDEDRKVRLGMLFYVLSDLILAYFFFGSYIFLRGYNTNDRWVPPPVAHIIGHGPVTATAWIMGIAVAGGVSYAVGQWALHRELPRLFTWAMVAALVLYFVDLALQVYVMGHQHYDVTDGSFASSFSLLSGYHVYHMALGVFLGLGIVNRAFRGLYRRGGGPRMTTKAADTHVGGEDGRESPHVLPSPRTTGIACIGYYWYYAALYSVALWLLLLVQPPLPLSA